MASQLFLRLVSLWVDHADLIGRNVKSPLRQKVWALALCRALQANNRGVLAHLPVILDIIGTIMIDERDRVRSLF